MRATLRRSVVAAAAVLPLALAAAPADAAISSGHYVWNASTQWWEIAYVSACDGCAWATLYPGDLRYGVARVVASIPLQVSDTGWPYASYCLAAHRVGWVGSNQMVVYNAGCG